MLQIATRAYPRRFRLEFAAEMQSAFEDRCTDSWRSTGNRGLANAAFRSIIDVVRSGLIERLRPSGSSHNNRLPQSPQGPRNVLASLLQDTRFAIRVLLKQPVFTAVAMVTLGLGIGANTAIFSLTDALLARPLPAIEKQDELFALYTSEDGGPLSVSSYADYRDLAGQLETVAGIAAYKPRRAGIATASGGVERIDTTLVTGSYFETLGIQPVAGRLIGPADDVDPDGHPVAVISYGLWQRLFAGSADVVSESLRVNRRAFRIIGVVPAGFRGTSLESGPELYVPMAMQAHMMPGNDLLLDRRGWSGVLLLGRVGEGRALEAVAAEIESVGAWLRETYRASSERTYHVTSFAEGMLLPTMRDTAMQVGGLLGLVSGLVLLIACVNVANLLLARAGQRTRELAVRQALGAGRRRILGQLLAESLVLSAAGGAVGIGLGAMLARTIGRVIPNLSVTPGLDARVLLFSALLTLATGLAFGLLPARRAAQFDVTARLRDGGPGVSSRQGLSRTLVVAQVAISITLLVTAGLFARTLINLSRADLGFDPAVATVGIDPMAVGYSLDEAATAFAAVQERVAAMPGVETVSVVNALPGSGGGDVSSFALEGYEPDGRPPRAFFNLVGPNYFEAMRIPIVEGRGITASDDLGGRGALVVNESLAAQIEDALGEAALGARLSGNGPDGPWMEVVGIAADSMTASIGAGPRPVAYLPQRQTAMMSLAGRLVLLVRAGNTPETVLGDVVAAVRELDGELPLFAVGTLRTHLDNALAQERATAVAIAVAALLALGLALVGVYGILACTVDQRSTELGVRMALGADGSHLVGLVLRQAILLIAIGSVIGLGASAALGTVVEGFLFEVPTVDVVTYGAVIGLMLLVSLAAAWIPARRATRLDPVRALRAE
ncbi:MAG: FtsX-like permease family protein [Acidobacteria bacterium]|nr:FtsX-like permease family protein [Acidobacteriota bacterium]